MGANDMTDLDFTAQPQKSGNAADDTMRPEVGAQRPGKGANHIVYARGGVQRRPAAPDAPILVVEDDEDTRRLLERILTVEGYPVRTAADSPTFIQALRCAPLPRLILLDVELPKISGFRLLGLLRNEPQTSDIPIVMVTARSENKDLLQGLASGADGYLSKPVSVDALRAIIAKVLQQTA